MRFTKGSFKHMVMPSDLERVESEIATQLESSGELQIDHVVYNIVTAKGNLKTIDDYGHLTESAKYGKVLYVTISELETNKPNLRLSGESQSSEDNVQKLVEYLGRTLDADRAYIFECNKNNEWDNTYEWCDEGIEPQIDRLQGIPTETTAVWNQSFGEGRMVTIRNLEEIKQSDPRVYEFLRPQDIHSIIVGPIYRGDRLYGFYGIDNPNVEKLDEISALVGTLSHIVTTSLEKRDALKRLGK